MRFCASLLHRDSKQGPAPEFGILELGRIIIDPSSCERFPEAGAIFGAGSILVEQTLDFSGECRGFKTGIGINIPERKRTGDIMMMNDECLMIY